MGKWKIGAVLVVGVVVLALVVAGAVLAQGPGDGPHSEDMPFVDEDGDGICDLQGEEGHNHRGLKSRAPHMGSGMGGMGMRGNSTNLIETVAGILGVDVSDIVAKIDAGATLREIVDDAGIEVETVASAFVSARSEHLGELVDEGRLTEEQAEAMLEHMEEMVTEHLNQEGLSCGAGMGHGGRGMWQNNGTSRTFGPGRRI